MSLSAPSAAPAGWYPDPSGSRQWRVWNGSNWSDVTRPYGEVTAAPRRSFNLALVQSLRRVLNLGVVGVVGGLGLLVSSLAHWPGTADPTSRGFAVVASACAVAMLLLGTFACAFAVRELKGRWTIEAFVPLANLFVVNALVAQRLGRPAYVRIGSEVVLLAVFVASSRHDVWLGLAPVIVAFGQSAWVSALIDQLNGPSLIDESSAS